MSDALKTNFIHNNTVYIHGEFDESITVILPKILDIITEQSKLKDGRLIFSINSYGGYVHVLHSLLNLVEYAKSQNLVVKTVVEHCAYSCASYLACSGTVGERYMSEYAQHLCHYMRAGMYIETQAQIERSASHLKEEGKALMDIYNKYCKPTRKTGFQKKLIEGMKDDSFYIKAKDCIDYGLCDHLL